MKYKNKLIEYKHAPYNCRKNGNLKQMIKIVLSVALFRSSNVSLTSISSSGDQKSQLMVCRISKKCKTLF